jgi:hypothetical protein
MASIRYPYSKYSFLFSIAIIAVSVLVSCGEPEQDDSYDFSAVTLPQNISPEEAVLTVSGKIKNGPVYLDMETVMRMPQISFIIDDPWDKKRQEYSGVPLYAFLRFLGMEEDAEYIELSAANGYKVSVKARDLQRYEYILAYKIDGTLLTESEEYTSKGNVIVALNFEKDEDIDVEIYKSQLVWQLEAIRVR